MTLLLITGAGASRNLGDEESMPLMRDWSDALCAALDQRETGLALSCGLSSGLDGAEFEKNLGLLLRWQQVRHLEERFQNLGGPQVGTHIGEVEKSRSRATKRLGTVMEALNETLYDQFGQRHVDDEKAVAAYAGLLRELGEPDLIVATTNYDRVAEGALVALGHTVDAGFRGEFPRTPRLEPAGLVSEANEKTPVIHLHGAVGWYKRDGVVEEHYADQPYNPSLGLPLVLYPDPDKDPTSDAIVSQLWTEFDEAIEKADAVLVIGHSLHDPALVRALRRASRNKPVVISFFNDDEQQRVEMIHGAVPVQMNFGPSTEADKPLGLLLEDSRRPSPS